MYTPNIKASEILCVCVRERERERKKVKVTGSKVTFHIFADSVCPSA